MAKAMLIVSRHSPWSGLGAREALDIALAGGAFELPIGMLFLDDGVFQLLPGQQPAAVEQKDLAANLQALPLFGVDDLYVCRQSLRLRGLDGQPLALPATPLEGPELADLFDRYDLVITL
ncbi:sulfurtransferase complex subunit TusC [Azotobacter chroococcum]|uniref:tRNA 2-thiouridine synthesizing protein C n=1 Tax=Azotobacter chroococcum TaxID=353 RepID=A0A4R1PLZ5_9GAMM|nr:sulfurtransferase complex subunit TusC [Azotobacter chroococcum]TBV99463.1 sulfurtransferase complex subunit TusC [Azotobacter chroococcum]TCL31232.1 tRNA 2-thiouridine synthesizing protein C [Azotobacter chroococcum]